MKRFLGLVLLSTFVCFARGQGVKADYFSTSSCVGCHGQSAMGGLGPPIANTKLTLEDFTKIVRMGKGMMPGTPEAEISNEKLAAIHSELAAKPVRESQIPLAFRVAQLLTTQNVGRLFLGVFLLSALFAIRGLFYWFRCAGVNQLLPRAMKFGTLKSLAVVIKSLIVDGFFVRSLWLSDRKRWLMHGLMLYGFFGLMLSDILLAIFNPTRGDLPMLHALKLLPVVSGVSVLMGVLYVMVRYRKDSYIDNGLTLGRDFLFVNLLLHTIVSGFMTVTMNRLGITEWIMTIYLYHIGAIVMLILTAPFTRFQHAWVVPIMVSVTRLTDAIAASGQDIGFQREPSPGRHHKSERIAESVLSALGPDYEGDFRLRYYP